jgi:hypothetical protein
MLAAGRPFRKGGCISRVLSYPQHRVTVGKYEVTKVAFYEETAKAEVDYRMYATRRILNVRQFLAAHPKGRFILTTRTHAFAVLDGRIHDEWQQTGLGKLDGAWKLEAIITQSQINELWERLNKLEGK